MVKPLPSVKHTVTLEESMLLSMAQSERFVQSFPFLSSLKSYASGSGGCNGCSGAKQVKRDHDFTTVKEQFFGMSDTDKKKLLSLLGAGQVRLNLRVGNRVMSRIIS